MSVDLRASLGLHGDALVLRERRNAILQSNIANAATPGYQARDFDFASALRAASDAPDAGPGLQSDLGWRIPSSATLDGNTVDIAAEQMAFAENTLRYDASLTLLNRRIASLTAAIKGE